VVLTLCDLVYELVGVPAQDLAGCEVVWAAVGYAAWVDAYLAVWTEFDIQRLDTEGFENIGLVSHGTCTVETQRIPVHAAFFALASDALPVRASLEEPHDGKQQGFSPAVSVILSDG
jgi:hypothetical protein